MSDTLTDKDITELVELGQSIMLSLSCNLNGDRFPSRTNRFQAVEDMKRYLEIHDYTVTI